MLTGESARLVQVLSSARETVAIQMAAFEASGLNWQEESITSQLLSTCFPSFRFATFTKMEEAATGGDWLWWWVDQTGEAFGMLVQAKRLQRPWSIDFEYRKGLQRKRLFETAEELRVPPMYALYLGSAAFREGNFCRARVPLTCGYCDAAAISIVPALLTHAGGGSPRDIASFAFKTPSLSNGYRTQVGLCWGGTPTSACWTKSCSPGSLSLKAALGESLDRYSIE